VLSGGLPALNTPHGRFTRGVVAPAPFRGRWPAKVAPATAGLSSRRERERPQGASGRRRGR
jgi:hypothetical protein